MSRSSLSRWTQQKLAELWQATCLCVALLALGGVLLLVLDVLYGRWIP